MGKSDLPCFFSVSSRRKTERSMQDSPVIIVGAGPSGLALSACLNLKSIPNMVLEREDCYASLWKKFAYDCLHLHLANHFCELPHMPFPSSAPKYISKDQFVHYLDHYTSHFKISPVYRRSVESAEFNESTEKWIVKAKNLSSGETEEYSGRFLVVASGETGNPFTPEVEGLRTFPGRTLHSTQFRSGKEFKDMNVLVVGSGNSGMEIALDLCNHGAKTSIVVRSPFHVLSRGMLHLALVMLKYIPIGIVDSLMKMLSNMVYGDLSKYGIKRPKEGPFFLKDTYGKYPVFDVGACKRIKSGEIQVLPAITSISCNEVLFQNGKSHPFDSIIFATGFKRASNKWLKEKGDDSLLGDDGIAKKSFPNHWKGKNGLYCIGLSRRGLYGINAEAKNIANDISSFL